MSDTTEIHTWLVRLKAGDDQARDELIRFAEQRLRIRASQMLKQDRVRRYEMTDDVVQEAMIQLHKTLKDIHPESVEHFLRLAARQIRRTLIDLARHHYGPHGDGTHRNSDGKPADEPGGILATAANEPEDLYDWTKFHETVEALPEDEKKVFDLIWYDGLKQVEVAELLGVSDKTIQRLWLKIRSKFGSLRFPE